MMVVTTRALTDVKTPKSLGALVGLDKPVANIFGLDVGCLISETTCGFLSCWREAEFKDGKDMSNHLIKEARRPRGTHGHEELGSKPKKISL